MDRKTENQLRQEIAEVWALLDAEREKATEQAGAYEQRLRNLEASMTAAVSGCQKRIAAMKENERLTDELRKDAERYRWLRDDAFEHSDDCFMEAGRLFAEKHGVAFDEAIDAAIAQERQP